MYITDLVNDDLWGMVAMSKAINEPAAGQAVSMALDDLFDEEGIDTISVLVEMQGNALSLVPSAPYGGPGDVTNLNRAKGEIFKLIYLPTQFHVAASEIQGVRTLGASELETMEMRRDRKLAKARQRIEGTIRFHRAKGLYDLKIYDANGSTVLLDIADRFGVTRATKSIALGTATTKVKTGLEQAKDLSADKIGGAATIVGWRMDCGRNYHAELVDHANVREAFDRYTSGAFLAQSQADRPFLFADIEVRKVYGQMAGAAGSGINFIDPDKAYLYPILDDAEAYKTWYGPAPYFDTVNTMGLPLYAAIMAQDPKGMTAEACAVALSLPKFPAAVVEMTKT